MSLTKTVANNVASRAGCSLASTLGGAPNYAYHYNGTDDFVNLGSGIFYGLGACSVSLWVYHDDLVGTQGYIGQWGSGQLAFLFRYSGSLQFYTHNGTTQVGGAVTNPPTATTWYHLAATYDGSNMRVYLDGTVDPTVQAQTGTLGQANGETHMGGSSAVAAMGWYDGIMEDVRIYNDALTQDEITYLANCGASGTDPGTANLIRHFKCDDTGSAAIDSTGNANGTKTGTIGASFKYDGSDIPCK